MRLFVFVMLILISAPLSGCIEVLEPITVDEDGACVILDAGRTSDGVLRILTYDIAAFSEEMMGAFENQTGYEVELIKADDSGGILEQLLQTQQAQQADLAIGLDNTYLQTALNYCLLQPHSANVSGISTTALQPYDGPRRPV